MASPVRGDPSAAAAVPLADMARDRFGLRASQLYVGKKVLTNQPGSIELVSTM